MFALCPAVYLIFVAVLSGLTLLWGPSVIDRIRGVECYHSLKVAEKDHLEMSAHSTSGCLGLDTSSSPLVACFERSSSSATTSNAV